MNTTRKNKTVVSKQELEDRLILRAWENKEFATQLLKDPLGTVEKEIAAMTGKRPRLRGRVRIHIHQETGNILHFVLPPPRDVVASEEKDLVVFWENVLHT